MRRADRGRLADALAPAGPAEPALPPAEQRRYAVEVDGARYDVSVALPADELLAAERRRRAERRARGGAGGPGGERVASPMQGTVLRVEVGEGDAVEAGQVLVIVEAMKMENEIRAHIAGVVRALAVAVGDSVTQRPAAAARRARRERAGPAHRAPAAAPWRPEDREPFAALNADPRVMEHFPALLPRRQSDALARALRAHFARHGFGPWAVEVPGVAPFIGFVGLAVPAFEAHFTPCVEIGWRLAAEHWGQGYATEAASRAPRHAFARGRRGARLVHHAAQHPLAGGHAQDRHDARTGRRFRPSALPPGTSPCSGTCFTTG